MLTSSLMSFATLRKFVTLFFFICKLEIIILPTLEDCCEDLIVYCICNALSNAWHVVSY